jgi:hypothetical protein
MGFAVTVQNGPYSANAFEGLIERYVPDIAGIALSKVTVYYLCAHMEIQLKIDGYFRRSLEANSRQDSCVLG